MVVAGQLHQLRTRDAPRHVARGLDVDQPVSQAVQEQGRHADRGQQAADVDLDVHAVKGHRRAGTGRQPVVAREQLALGRVVGDAGRHGAHADRRAPALRVGAEGLLVVLAARCPRIAGLADPARVGPVHDERARAFRVGRGEKGAHRPAFGDPEERRLPGARRVHHGAHVIHALLERRQVGIGDPVGHPGAPLVEENQARKRGQAVQKAGDERILPLVLDVRDPAAHDDQVERRIAHDLVGDVHVATPGVLDRVLHDPKSRPSPGARARCPRARRARRRSAERRAARRAGATRTPRP